MKPACVLVAGAGLGFGAYYAARAVLRLAARWLRRIVPPVPGLPVDGEPLSDDEEWRLGEISMDSIIDVPEPAYDTGETL